MSKSKTSETSPAGNPDVVIVRTATAAKLSPRGEGGITYQVGRVGDDVYVRIHKNEGGGSHSHEFVSASAIKACVTPAMKNGSPFKSDALVSAFVGKSQCNSGFLVACLRAENLFCADPEHKGLSRLTGDLDAWERAMRDAEPILKEGGQPETAKLHPEPKETRFRPKADSSPPDGAPDDTETEAPRKMMVRIKKKPAKRESEAGESEATPADDGETSKPSGGSDPADA